MGSLVYEDLSYKIRGALFEVYNTLGFGHKEIVYQKALAEEFLLRKIPFKREVHIPDFIIDDKVIFV